MHFTTIVILKADNKTLDNIRKKLTEESRAYLTEDMKNTICTLFDVNLSDNEAIAKKLSEMHQTKTGVDEKGVYGYSLVFKDALIEQCRKKIEKPLAKLDFFDYYDIFDLRMTDDLLDNIDKYDRFPDSIVTPDLKLVRSPRAFMMIDENSSNYQDFIDWQNNFKETLKQYYSNSFSLVLDCHV